MLMGWEAEWIKVRSHHTLIDPTQHTLLTSPSTPTLIDPTPTHSDPQCDAILGRMPAVVFVEINQLILK